MPRPRTSKASVGLSEDHVERHVLLGGALEAGLEVPGRHVLAVLARARRVVDPELHGERRAPRPSDARARPGCSGSRHRVADLDALHAGDGDHVAGLDDGGLDAPHGLEDEGRGLTIPRLRVPSGRARAGTVPAGSVPDSRRPMAMRPTKRSTSTSQTGRATAAVGVALRRRDVLDDAVEDRQQVRLEVVRGGAGDALATRRVEDGEVQVVVVGAELDEEVVDEVQDLARARVAPVDLVDDDDRLAARAPGPCAARSASAASAPRRRPPAAARRRPCGARARPRRRSRRGRACRSG